MTSLNASQRAKVRYMVAVQFMATQAIRASIRARGPINATTGVRSPSSHDATWDCTNLTTAIRAQALYHSGQRKRAFLEAQSGKSSKLYFHSSIFKKSGNGAVTGVVGMVSMSGDFNYSSLLPNNIAWRPAGQAPQIGDTAVWGNAAGRSGHLGTVVYVNGTRSVTAILETVKNAENKIHVYGSTTSADRAAIRRISSRNVVFHPSTSANRGQYGFTGVKYGEQRDSPLYTGP